MERIIKSFKDLYAGEDIKKRHLQFLLLLILPIICGSFFGIIDKGMPKELIITLLIVGLCFSICAIIPWFFLLGFNLDFCKLRLDDQVGIPKIEFETFIKGLKIFPISLVWGLYTLILTAVVMAFPIYSLVTMNGRDTGSVIITIILTMLIFFMYAILLMLLAPFSSIVYFKFVENGFKYSPELFNPLIIIPFIKKAFVKVIIVLFKYLIVSILFSFIYSIVAAIFWMICFGIGFMSSLNTSDPNSIYTLPILIFLIIGTSLLSLGQTYASTMIGYSALDNYIEVYKKYVK